MITRKIVSRTAVALVVMTAIACETVIDYKGPETEPKVVIYALLHPDSLVKVTISESHTVFQVPWQPRQIKDATVRVYRDGELLETLTYVEPPPVPDYYPLNPNSQYISFTTKPEYGHIYRIEAEVPGFAKAYGETQLPVPVAVEVADTSSQLMGYGYREMTVKLKFRDPGVSENYYKVSATTMWGIYRGDKSGPYNPESAVSVSEIDISYGFGSDPLISPRQDDDLFDMSVPNNYNIFSDELISGKEYTLRCASKIDYPDTDYYEFVHRLYRLSTITKDLYLYLQSYAAYSYTNDNFLAEPVPVYTNITNGLGVVGAMSTMSASVKIGDFPVDGVNYEEN
ncbi:MAG: DUF4249 domain-containing protein [Bacteroidales bacterium]|nr:DUF4249 domain-containing protein [Bacteroidales bacterium]